MKKQIIINASKDRSRIAIVEDGELVELYVENPDNVRTLGNIYLGKVQKVMPALRAAFVDVGLKQDAFLHFSDLTDNAPQLLAMAGEDIPGLDTAVLSLAPSKRIADDDSEADVEDALEVEAETPRSRTATRRRRGGRGRTRTERPAEEDEQEEAGEERPRRRSLVIDLTSKPSRPAPRRAAPTDATDANGAARATAPETPSDAPAADPAPSRRRTRGAAPLPPPDADTPVEPPVSDTTDEAPEATVAPDPEMPDADATDAPSGRRRGGRRRGRGGRTAEPSTDAPTETLANPADANPIDVRVDEEPTAAPAGRRAGRRADDVVDEREETTNEAPAPRRTTDSSRRRVDALLDAALGDLTAPVARRPLPPILDEEESVADRERLLDDRQETEAAPRSRRGTRRDADERRADEPRAVAPLPRTEEVADEADDDEPRSRRGSRRGRRDDEAREAEPTTRRADPAPRDEATEAPAPRGRRTAEPDRPEPSRRERPGGRSEGRASDGRAPESRSAAPRPSGGKLPPTEELLRRDGRVLVKVTKEPISSKGSRVSTDLSIAGRFLVLVPAADYVAVSKKIESAKERRRLRTLAQSLKPEGFGVIVRTVAEGRDAKSLDTDLRLLADKWRAIEKKLAEKPKPPVLLYEDVNMVSSIIRDLFSDDYDRIVVDDPKVFKNVQAYVRAVAPQMADKVELHRAATPIFRAVGIERQVEEAFSKRVNLKGGGYLFIETTEAMHVVDVNSGRAGRGKSQKDNLIAVNVEAAREVAKQLRLRDLGGIIVVDFIDLKYDRDRKKVTDALKEAFAKDRAVTKLLPMSDFGLVQITRQRLRPSITTQADEDGEPLDAEARARAAGAGEIAQPGRRWDDDRADDAPDDRRADTPRLDADVPVVAEDATPEALTLAVRAWLDRYRASVDARYKSRPILVRVHPLLGAHLRRGLFSPVARWKLALRGIPFQLQDDPSIHPFAFDVRDEKSGRSLRKKYA